MRTMAMALLVTSVAYTCAARPATFRKIVMTGDVAPGYGASFDSIFSSDHSINASGKTAFSAILDDGRLGVWSDATGSLVGVAVRGDVAPGTGGATFRTYLPGPPLINDTGDVLVGRVIEGTGVTSANESGLWFGQPGAMQLALRGGDPAPGTIR